MQGGFKTLFSRCLPDQDETFACAVKILIATTSIIECWQLAVTCLRFISRNVCSREDLFRMSCSLLMVPVCGKHALAVVRLQYIFPVVTTYGSRSVSIAEAQGGRNKKTDET